MIEMVELFNREPERSGKPVIAIGIGIASGERDRRLHRHPAARDLHLRRRCGEPGRAARGTHEDGGTCGADRRRHPTRAGRAVPVRSARRGGHQGQVGAGRGVFTAARTEESSNGRVERAVYDRRPSQILAIQKVFRRMSATKPRVPSPSSIVLHTASRVLEIAFDDGASFRLPFEFLRVYSPSAEVRGHGPGQETLQAGKRDVTIDDLAACRALRRQAGRSPTGTTAAFTRGTTSTNSAPTRSVSGPTTWRASTPRERAASRRSAPPSPPAASLRAPLTPATSRSAMSERERKVHALRFRGSGRGGKGHTRGGSVRLGRRPLRPDERRHVGRTASGVEGICRAPRQRPSGHEGARHRRRHRRSREGFRAARRGERRGMAHRHQRLDAGGRARPPARRGIDACRSRSVTPRSFRFPPRISIWSRWPSACAT